MSVKAQPIAIVVVGASAGGLDALGRFLKSFPDHFPAPIVVVQHLPAREESRLASVLRPDSKLPVCEAEDKTPLRPGAVYVAPPNYHVLVEADGHLALDADEPVNYCRPSADVLFQSAATAFGEKAVAVVLTGANADGAEGAAAIRRAGGRVFVQALDDAAFPMMPRSALERCQPDLVAPVETLGEALVRLAAEPPE